MEIVVKSNDANKPMLYPPYTIGNVIPPDEMYSPRLFSHWEATQKYNKMDQDIYEAQKYAKPADLNKTPKSVIWGVGIAGILGVCYLIKKFIFKK